MNQLLVQALSKAKVLKRLNIYSTRRIDNKSFVIPILRSNGKDNLIDSEKWMTQLLTMLFDRKHGSFVDVGANIGQTLLKVKSINPTIKYYGFEPNPICVFYLNELIAKNKFETVSLFPVGISNKTEVRELHFFYDSDTDAAASMISDFRPWQQVLKKMYIPCYTISDLKNFVDLSKIGIIKIDVEGAELEVLNGVSKAIDEARPFIIAEILPVYKVENKDRFERQHKIGEFLTNRKYKIFRVLANPGGELQKFQFLRQFDIHSSMDLTNYVFVPEEIEFAEK